jgi:hypothetical protein
MGIMLFKTLRNCQDNMGSVPFLFLYASIIIGIAITIVTAIKGKYVIIVEIKTAKPIELKTVSATSQIIY